MVNRESGIGNRDRGVVGGVIKAVEFAVRGTPDTGTGFAFPIHYFLFTLFALAASAAGAQTTLSVESLQMPVFLEREGARSALATGTELRTGDVVQTGEDARAVLRLPDGASVRLGAQTRLRVLDLESSRISAANPMFGVVPGTATTKDELTLRVRLHSGLARFVNDREPAGTGFFVVLGDMQVSLRQGSVLAILQRDPEACLLSGRALVLRGSKVLSLVDENTCFGAEGVKPATLLSEIQPKIEKPAPPAGKPVTAVASAKPAAKSWKVNIYSPTDQREAQAVLKRLQDAGYAADVLPVVVKGRQHYRVRITGMQSKEQAIALAAKLPGKFGPGKPWVTLD